MTISNTKEHRRFRHKFTRCW